MPRVEVKPELLRWAVERSRVDALELATRFPQLEAWKRSDRQPTLKQLETFAKATHTPLGFLLLPEPPVERLPIRDLRTVVHGPKRPSADLLDTIYAMQRRQDWLREDRIESEAGPHEFVGSARLTDDPAAVGREMRRMLVLADGWASTVSTWLEAVSELRRRIEQLGVLAVINGVVGNNTHRKLDVGGFRGFALTDSYAPVIFVNGADAKSAQCTETGGKRRLLQQPEHAGWSRVRHQRHSRCDGRASDLKRGLRPHGAPWRRVPGVRPPVGSRPAVRTGGARPARLAGGRAPVDSIALYLLSMTAPFRSTPWPS